MKRLITIAVSNDQEVIDSVANWMETCISTWHYTPDDIRDMLRAIVTGLRGLTERSAPSPAQTEIKVTLADPVTGLLARLEKAVDMLVHPPYEHNRMTFRGLAEDLFHPRCRHREVSEDAEECGAFAEFMLYNRFRQAVPSYACLAHFGHAYRALLAWGEDGMVVKKLSLIHI